MAGHFYADPFAQIGVATGCDGIHETAVFSFRGDRPFAFGSVATGGFGAALLFFFGQLLFDIANSPLEMEKALFSSAG